MAYGTEPFTDGYGDYKQPTVIDYDRKVNNTFGNKPYQTTKEEKEQILTQYQKDQEEALREILESNPVFAGDFYQHLTIAINNKLSWNFEKINELKSNVDWLYGLKRFLNKKKDEFYSK